MGDINTNIRIDDLENLIRKIIKEQVTEDNIVEILTNAFTKNVSSGVTTLQSPTITKFMGKWQFMWIEVEPES